MASALYDKLMTDMKTAMKTQFDGVLLEDITGKIGKEKTK